MFPICTYDVTLRSHTLHPRSVILISMTLSDDVRKMYVKDLRINKAGNKRSWTNEELLAGFHKFYEEYGHFPTAHEIEAYQYLPSSRSIQRSYGGLVKLRSSLLPSEISNFTKGIRRSAIAKRTFANGRMYEKKFYEYLIEHFQEIAVHEHKLIRPGDVSCDFYVYITPCKGLVIDVFYAESLPNLVNIVNIKLKRYKLIQPETYLVLVGNEEITQTMIDAKVANRQVPLPAHIYLVSEEHFKLAIMPELQRYSDYSL